MAVEKDLDAAIKRMLPEIEEKLKEAATYDQIERKAPVNYGILVGLTSRHGLYIHVFFRDRVYAWDIFHPFHIERG